jgi:hypothetical protein
MEREIGAAGFSSHRSCLFLSSLFRHTNLLGGHWAIKPLMHFRAV